jgi:hypothetical protein
MAGRHSGDFCICGGPAALSWLPQSPEQKEGIEDPVEMERVADENADKAHTRFIVSSDPGEIVEKIGTYLDSASTTSCSTPRSGDALCDLDATGVSFTESYVHLL